MSSPPVLVDGLFTVGERAPKNGEPRLTLSFAIDPVDHLSPALVVTSVPARGRDPTAIGQTSLSVIEYDVARSQAPNRLASAPSLSGNA